MAYYAIGDRYDLEDIEEAQVVPLEDIHIVIDVIE